ncbi:hypothetical protein P4493_04600 [Bacillus thuringiensis]|uniref:Membrane protein n=3 Tax=Bacillus thuringiensis TaxID=1428 RepID=A0A0B5NL22_BACTU|nr:MULTISPECIES: hypothetical protein [Bacillus]EAO56964.1 hypothetical protein RBTH_07702 [Bacillus thuringiensis serovar israelensis ATCC 35646]MEC2535157.1 hypothetical protein [Bacillus cereus]MED1153728.1 hypothetical protein [Bacillus paranthracis]OUB09400.1 hypothetical protein BK708_33305 [Bacillus thuringiensis serovar yunnanensis]AFQ30047.1 hypothetical protein BTF1_29732 [Bacillus thuringiensis HD-789]
MEFVYILNSIFVVIVWIITIKTCISFLQTLSFNKKVMDKEQGYDDKELLNIENSQNKVKNQLIFFLVINALYVTTDGFAYTVHALRNLI